MTVHHPRSQAASPRGLAVSLLMLLLAAALPAVSSNHATHVAGSALGTGGSAGTFGGVAPCADLVDQKVLSDAGAGIVSADGSLLTDGRQYQVLSGTSMSTPHTAGVVALLLAANPALTPSQVVEILKHTSEHRSAWGKSPADPYGGSDPNYHPSGGWGQVDAYAAVKEALRLAGDPASQTQLVYMSGDAAWRACCRRPRRAPGSCRSRRAATSTARGG